MDAFDTSLCEPNLNLEEWDHSNCQSLMDFLPNLDLELEKVDSVGLQSVVGGVDSPGAPSTSGSPLPSPQAAPVTPDLDASLDLLYMANQLNITVTDGRTTSPDSNIVGITPDTDVSDWLACAVSEADILEDEPMTHYLTSVAPPSPSNHVTSTSTTPGNGTEISDTELTSLSVKQLNRRLQSLTRDQVRRLKQRRRTLKNRGYAADSRERRQKCRSELEAENRILFADLEKTRSSFEELKSLMRKVEAERDHFKNQCERLMEQQVPSSPVFSFS